MSRSHSYVDRCHNTLFENGYAVFPCIDNPHHWRRRLDEEMLASPEYKEGIMPFVLGGFGALGHPTSFHTLSVRDLRFIAYQVFFTEVFGCFNDSYQMEAVIDRLMIRPNYRKPTAEHWHRDEAIGVAPGDVVFGGWINLDDSPQYFSCHPGSQARDAVSSNGGFKPATQAEKSAAKEYKAAANNTPVLIPPGHLLVFNETLVHEVMSKFRNETSYRLFTGFRISKKSSGPKCLHDRAFSGKPSLFYKILMGDIIPLKSGQLPRMYPALTWSNKSLFKELTANSRDSKKTFNNPSLTSALNPKWLEFKKRKPPGEDVERTEMLLAPEVCTSLASKDYPPPQYRNHDMAILFPHSVPASPEH